MQPVEWLIELLKANSTYGNTKFQLVTWYVTKHLNKFLKLQAVTSIWSHHYRIML